MNVLDQIRVIVYRVHEKGLEILMLSEEQNDSNIPAGTVGRDFQKSIKNDDNWIHLDDKNLGDGDIRTVAVEGDWHDIPSIRALIKKDLNRLERKVKKVMPDLEECTYVAIKEAAKKSMPHEYAAIKELKDILTTRNMINNM